MRMYAKIFVKTLVSTHILFRKHEFVSGVSYHGNCADTTVDWQEAEDGVAANVRVKRPAGRSVDRGPRQPQGQVPSRQVSRPGSLLVYGSSAPTPAGQ